MKCIRCGTDNKDSFKTCRKCGVEMKQVPLWRPSWKWHVKTLAIIYTSLIVLFFLFNHLLAPYLRQIPKDITPWLKDLPQEEESVG